MNTIAINKVNHIMDTDLSQVDGIFNAIFTQAHLDGMPLEIAKAIAVKTTLQVIKDKVSDNEYSQIAQAFLELVN